jgi:hypothetical protein
VVFQEDGGGQNQCVPFEQRFLTNYRKMYIHWYLEVKILIVDNFAATHKCIQMYRILNQTVFFVSVKSSKVMLWKILTFSSRTNIIVFSLLGVYHSSDHVLYSLLCNINNFSQDLKTNVQFLVSNIAS